MKIAFKFDFFDGMFVFFGFSRSFLERKEPKMLYKKATTAKKTKKRDTHQNEIVHFGVYPSF